MCGLVRYGTVTFSHVVVGYGTSTCSRKKVPHPPTPPSTTQRSSLYTTTRLFSCGEN